MKQIIALLALALTLDLALAKEFHVSVIGDDKDKGSAAKPFKTISAAAQVAHFDLARAPKPAKLLLGMNALLRPDIRILRLARTRPDFHARFDAAGKEYRYFIWNDVFAPPWLRLYRAAVRRPLDVAAMRKAARLLAGRRDFAAFSANPHREIAGTVRHLRRLTVTRRGREVVIAATGDGFLYKMVRSLAGFLIRVGTGELDPAQATHILDSKVRTAVVPTAPAAGLFLWRVRYAARKAR